MADLEIKGVSALLKQLDAIGLEMGDKALDAAVREGAKVLKAEIERDTPLDTGFAASHVLVKKAGSAKKDNAVYSVGFERNAFYAWFLELGTRFRAATPFVLPALDRKAPEILDTIRQKLAEALKRASKKAG